jgi:hypothetical protein
LQDNCNNIGREKNLYFNLAASNGPGKRHANGGVAVVWARFRTSGRTDRRAGKLPRGQERYRDPRASSANRRLRARCRNRPGKPAECVVKCLFWSGIQDVVVVERMKSLYFVRWQRSDHGDNPLRPAACRNTENGKFIPSYNNDYNYNIPRLEQFCWGRRIIGDDTDCPPGRTHRRDLGPQTPLSRRFCYPAQSERCYTLFPITASG